MRFINPLEQKNWNETLLDSGVNSFFYTQAWARVLSETYGYRPNYLIETEHNKFQTLIPLMEVKSLLTGKRAASLPFTDVCSAHFSEPAYSVEALHLLRETGAQRGWKYVEFRDAESVLRKPSGGKYYLHQLDLSSSAEKLFAAFRNNMRRNIRKAEKLDLAIDSGDSVEMVEQYFKMHCLTRKKHGVPPQSIAFFRNIHTHIIKPGLGFVTIAYHKNEPVAGAVFFHFADRAIYKFAASNPAFSHLKANNLLIWQAIRQLQNLDMKSLNFGRTDVSNKGLRHFKLGWGAEESVIGYYRENLLSKPQAATTKQSGENVFTKIFRGLPIPALKVVGRLAYPHMG